MAFLFGDPYFLPYSHTVFIIITITAAKPPLLRGVIQIIHRILQAFLELLHRHRPVKEKSLRDVAMIFPQDHHLLLGLDTLCHALQTDLSGHGNDVLVHHVVLADDLLVIRRQEGLVDLQHLPRDILQKSQGRVAHSEVVDRRRNPGLMKSGNHASQVREGHVRRCLRQLDLDVLMRNLVPIHDIDDIFEKVGLGEIFPGKIHAHPDDLFAFVHPSSQVVADLIEDIVIQLADIGILLQHRDELHRRNDLAVAEPPAQGLGADQFAPGDVDLGLVKDVELVRSFNAFGKISHLAS